MIRSQRVSLFLLLSVLFVLVALIGQRPARAMQQRELDIAPIAACDLSAVSRAKAEVNRLSAMRRFDASSVSISALRAASLEYVAHAEACYQELYGPPTAVIDDGGLTLGVGGAEPFALFGTKWGAGSPYISTGVDANGPRVPGGTVTYSFMADGIGGFESEGPSTGTSVAITSLPTFASCFITEITDAFAAWSAIADVQFIEVPDGGQPFNAAGAVGDIRIAAHAFDGASGILAHAFFPPPNGISASGDMHFDAAENWSCNPGGGVIDLGIVAAHEIGHSIGLNHENRFIPPGRTALMNPFYNPSLVSTILGDDINGAENIYGSTTGNSPDAIVDFGELFGAWILDYGVGWTQLHPVSPEQVAAGDLDGNGVDDLVVDFGNTYGVWIRMNSANWAQLHVLSPTNIAIGDLDNNGRDDIVIDFTGYGVWRFMNNASWLQLHEANSTAFAIGNIDNLVGDDVVLTFPGLGVWRLMNNAAFQQVDAIDADQIVIGDLDETASAADNADDLVLNLPGLGLFVYPNLGGRVQVGMAVDGRIATGDINGDGRDELVVDFGAGYGVWIINFGVGATQLHEFSADDLILGDLDNNGRAEIVVDFGENVGLWILVNSTTWIQAHTVSPEGLSIADLN